ncbi:MAG: membrane protein insertion efficiency factor YidD [Christensenellales bacterium]
MHGPWKGLGLALWRVLRCNPFSKGGVDPVPPKKMEYKGK